MRFFILCILILCGQDIYGQEHFAKKVTFSEDIVSNVQITNSRYSLETVHLSEPRAELFSASNVNFCHFDAESSDFGYGFSFSPNDTLIDYYFYSTPESSDNYFNNDDFAITGSLRAENYPQTSCMIYGDDTGFLWGKRKLSGVINQDVYLNNDIIFLVSNDGHVAQINQNGNYLSNKKYYVTASGTSYYLADFASNETSFAFCGAFGYRTKGYLVKSNEEGNEIINKSYDDFHFTNIEFLNSGEIIVAGRKVPGTVGLEDLPYDNNLYLIKFSQDLEPMWTKRILSKPELPRSLKLNVLEGGFAVKIPAGGAGGGFYSMIFDNHGNLTKAKGIPQGGRSNILSEGSAFIMNQFPYQGLNFPDNQLIIAHTNINLELPDCPTYDVCLEIEEYGPLVPYEIDFVVTSSNDTLIPMDFISEPLSFTVEDYCETVPPPVADFYTPDTLCRTDCLLPEPEFNATAEYVEWHLAGADIDSTFSEFIEPFCLDSAGVYELTQTVWFFGCTESYGRTLTVLPDLEVSFTGEDLRCIVPPFNLTVQGNRPLTEFIWSDGSTETTLPLYADGNYAVTASDGYCTDTTESGVRFAFPPGFFPEFSAGDDLELCQGALEPAEIRPTANFTDIFTVDDSTDSVFTARIPGQYIISAVNDRNCTFYDTLTIRSVVCRPDIYFPNAFSPDFNGINDYWEAVGNDFTLTELTVFDRWGGLILRRADGEAKWDGRKAGNPLPEGVYVVVLRYIHTETGKEGVMSGDVTLLR